MISKVCSRAPNKARSKQVRVNLIKLEPDVAATHAPAPPLFGGFPLGMGCFSLDRPDDAMTDGRSHTNDNTWLFSLHTGNHR